MRDFAGKKKTTSRRENHLEPDNTLRGGAFVPEIGKSVLGLGIFFFLFRFFG